MGLFNFFGCSKSTDLDQSVLTQLKKAGSDLSKPHKIEFFLYFPDHATAEQAGSRVRASGFEVEVRQAAKSPEWLCFTKKTMIPELSALQKIRRDFGDLAASMGGQYDGWGTPVEK